MSRLNSETCAQLQQRLRKAESAVREAIDGTAEDKPLQLATQELLKTHRETRNLLPEAEATQAPKQLDVVDAEIEIGRKEHEHKPEFKDILKAIFMWHDDPHERANES
jgi:hypothetical protein